MAQAVQKLRALENKHRSSERASGAPSAPPIVIPVIPQFLQGHLLSGLEQPPTQNTAYQPRQFNFAFGDVTPSGNEPLTTAQPTMSRTDLTPNMEENIDYALAEQSLLSFDTLDEIPPIASSSNISSAAVGASKKRSAIQAGIAGDIVLKNPTKRRCMKCRLPECKGASSRQYCQNACSDCASTSCQGRNSRYPDLPCIEGWKKPHKKLKQRE